jgi:hypothetical protein
MTFPRRSLAANPGIFNQIRGKIRAAKTAARTQFTVERLFLSRVRTQNRVPLLLDTL